MKGAKHRKHGHRTRCEATSNVSLKLQKLTDWSNVGRFCWCDCPTSSQAVRMHSDRNQQAACAVPNVESGLCSWGSDALLCVHMNMSGGCHRSVACITSLVGWIACVCRVHVMACWQRPQVLNQSVACSLAPFTCRHSSIIHKGQFNYTCRHLRQPAEAECPAIMMHDASCMLVTSSAGHVTSSKPAAALLH